MKRVLITGAAGYIGTPLVRALEDDKDIALYTSDAHYRDQWVNECGGTSLTEYKKSKIDYYLDLAQPIECLEVLERSKPDVIVHLASQPSAPYSHLSTWKRIWTQNQNMAMMQNLLYLSKDLVDNGTLKELPFFIVATTTGIPGAPNLAIKEEPMANLAGSSYHVSRGFDSANLNLAARQWGARILELRTAIVYGTRVRALGLEKHKFAHTRLDWDFYFGTVVHRFALLAKMGLPLTIYGKGEQRKPLISLTDCVLSFAEAIRCSHNFNEGHQIMNQFTECVEMRKLGNIIGGSNIKNIPNPRVENEEHKMIIENDRFMRLLDRTNPTVLVDDVVEIMEDMVTSKLPVNWEDAFNGKR